MAKVRQARDGLPTSIFIDLQIVAVACLFGGISYFMNPAITVWMFSIGVAAVGILYVLYSLWLLRTSKAAPKHQLNAVRCSVRTARHWRATGIFFRPTILLRWSDPFYDMKLAHEIGHIRAGDHRFYIIIKPILMALFLAYMTAFASSVMSTDWQWQTFGNEVPWFVVFAVFFLLLLTALTPIFVFCILILAPRDREYLADLFALKLLGGSYAEYMDGEAAFRRSFTPRNVLTKWFERFTHPSYSLRASALLKSRFQIMEASFVSGALFASTLMLLDTLTQLAGGTIETDLRAALSGVSDNREIAVAYQLGTVFVLMTSMPYASVVIAFTVSLNGTMATCLKMAAFVGGIAVVKVFHSFPRFDVLDPAFWMLWHQSFWDFLFADGVFVAILLAIWLAAKYAKGSIDDFSVWGHLSACAVTFVVYFGVPALIS